VVSGTPRAFLLPLLAGLGWALVRGREVLAGLLVGVTAFFYPQGSLVGLGWLGLRLVVWRRPGAGWRPGLSRVRRQWLASMLAGLLVVVAVVPLQAASSRFGPVVTGEQARQMPEFRSGGRNGFFTSDPYQFWIAGGRSGLNIQKQDLVLRGVPILYEIAALAALLPLLLLVRRQAPTVAALNPRTALFGQLLVASFGLFLLAHLLLFRLHLPTRYVKWSLQLVLICAAGLGIGMAIQLLVSRVRTRWRGPAAGGLALALALGLTCYPTAYHTFFANDRFPRINAYLRTQPKDTLLAGLPTETNSLPSFSGRPVLFSMEHALAFHLGYYGQMNERLEALIRAFYAESPEEVVAFAKRYGVDLFMVDLRAYDPAYVQDLWGFFPGRTESGGSLVRELFREGNHYALQQAAIRCPRLMDRDVVALVPVRCVTRL
jgi:hypothetical protein